MADELREMVGPDVHPMLVAELERRRSGPTPPLAHPAEVPVRLASKKRR
jgi:hypothetical protein